MPDTEWLPNVPLIWLYLVPPITALYIYSSTYSDNQQVVKTCRASFNTMHNFVLLWAFPLQRFEPALLEQGRKNNTYVFTQFGCDIDLEYKCCYDQGFVLFDLREPLKEMQLLWHCPYLIV